jgi:hypothetical protein
MRTPPWRHAGLLLAGIPLLAPIGASAATPTVRFQGKPVLQLGALTCPSKPSTDHLTVTVGNTVNIINATGKPATLYVGDATAIVPDGSYAPVTFRSAGNVTVSMVPQCALNLAAPQPMTITSVLPATAKAPAATSTGPPLGHASAPTTTAGAKPSHAIALASPSSSPTEAAGGAIGTVHSTGRQAPSPLLTLIAVIGIVGVAWAGMRAMLNYPRSARP